MNADRWQQIKDLFASALGRPPDERSAFVREACGDDEALRVELESLLAAYQPDESEPDHEPVHSRRDTATPLEGQRIGPYQLIREIGAGGMGTVYLAARADDAFRKHVAIKIVQANIDTQEILKRFRHERQILATLDHPNIARLLDGGTTPDGLPYFVMDYVEGTRIDEYCLGHRLTIGERVRLFRDVCSAVQYVHQNLVVHRDLKPGNVLVSPEGVPKLLDFGIAKLLKPELFAATIDATRVEFRLMTPGYASPEQVRGEPVTTVSDVYSLGVMLYELLAGRRPYRVKTDAPAELLRAVCDQDPEKPSTGAPPDVQRQLAGDLDAILLKALRKEPQRRYGSVEQFSEDLARYLDGRPVRAHADTWSYRTGKFVRRHRAGVAAAILVVVTLTGGVLATSWQARIARAERARAERQFNDVRRLSTSCLFEFHSAIQQLPGATPARQLLVQRALEYLSKLAGEAGRDRGLQQELAEAYLKVGDVQGNPYIPNLGDAEGAMASYQHALEISQQLREADPNDAVVNRYLARSYKSLGDVLPQVGRPTEALAHFRQATAILESLVADHPGGTGAREDLAAAYQALGDLQGHSGLQNLGDAAGAIESYRKGLALYESLLAIDGHNKTALRGDALLRIRIGDMQLFKDDLRGSLDAYRQALEISKRLAAEDPTNADDRRRLALAYRKAGGVQEVLGDTGEALRNYAQAATLNESLMNADPANVQASMSYVISARWTGDLMRKTGDASGALAQYRRVLAILERLAATQPNNVTVQERRAEMLVVAAQLLFDRGDVAAARPMTAQGLSLMRSLAARPDATPDDLSQFALSFLTCQPADLREPATALRLALASVSKSGGTDSDNLDILAQAYFASGDRPHAIETEERALRLLAPPPPGQPDPPSRRKIVSRLATFKTPAMHK
jgi:non-specific serine/threonine protein kinase/serine/threonine-protein kinase